MCTSRIYVSRGTTRPSSLASHRSIDAYIVSRVRIYACSHIAIRTRQPWSLSSIIIDREIEDLLAHIQQRYIFNYFTMYVVVRSTYTIHCAPAFQLIVYLNPLYLDPPQQFSFWNNALIHDRTEQPATYTLLIISIEMRSGIYILLPRRGIWRRGRE